MRAKKDALASRIKKMMQTDDDVGKISQATPVLIGRAMEMFLARLCTKTAQLTQERGAKTVAASHIKAVVCGDDTLDFLRELVASAPDLPPLEAAAAGGEGEPRVKRRRTGESQAAPDIASGATSPTHTPRGGSGAGRGRGRGRGRKTAAAAAAAAAADSAGSPGDEAMDAAGSNARPVAIACQAASSSQGGHSNGHDESLDTVHAPSLDHLHGGAVLLAAGTVAAGTLVHSAVTKSTSLGSALGAVGNVSLRANSTSQLQQVPQLIQQPSVSQQQQPLTLLLSHHASQHLSQHFSECEPAAAGLLPATSTLFFGAAGAASGGTHIGSGLLDPLMSVPAGMQGLAAGGSGNALPSRLSEPPLTLPLLSSPLLSDAAAAIASAPITNPSGSTQSTAAAAAAGGQQLRLPGGGSISGNGPAVSAAGGVPLAAAGPSTATANTSHTFNTAAVGTAGVTAARAAGPIATAGGCDSGGRGSKDIIASLRAQSPFFGLGRKAVRSKPTTPGVQGNSPAALHATSTNTNGTNNTHGSGAEAAATSSALAGAGTSTGSQLAAGCSQSYQQALQGMLPPPGQSSSTPLAGHTPAAATGCGHAAGTGAVGAAGSVPGGLDGGGQAGSVSGSVLMGAGLSSQRGGGVLETGGGTSPSLLLGSGALAQYAAACVGVGLPGGDEDDDYDA